MSDDHIRYDDLTQEALLGVVRSVLQDIAKSGLPGDHHFYIVLDTQVEGVTVSNRLKEQYPDEITIVLQYQFWDLEVGDDRFEVKLSFNNRPERLVVPFKAIKAFFDPSVRFGLQFGVPGAANDESGQTASVPAIVKQNDDIMPTPVMTDPAADPALEPAIEQIVDGDGDGEPEEELEVVENNAENAVAEVVELDAFRKK